MKIRRNKLAPMNSHFNSLKKTKLQFSARLSGCVGEHQSQEFFDKVNITRQSGISSKTNSFSDKRSNSFRQTLQLTIPFVADFSDSKQYCICYPVHFFRKKLHSYDSEDNRFASIRIYFPASRMKTGDDFKLSFDLKKRFHMHPCKFEFVGYSSLITLPLEDLSLAVFRAKSSSEKFKISSSLAIPKILISQSISISQTGTPIFIGTERIYSRIVKLITCSQCDVFTLNPSLTTTSSESKLHLRKCLLKWIGLQDFLPSCSRMIFVRRVSSDSGQTLAASILNSPGPKIRRTRVKENERLSIRLKPTKLEFLEESEDDTKDSICPEELQSQSTKVTNYDILENKRPRGRPKKLFDKSQHRSSSRDVSNMDEFFSLKEDYTVKLVMDNIKCDFLQQKSESNSDSVIDSTSEEKYSVQLSSCTTPDTNKSCSPIILNDTVTTSACSMTSSFLNFSTQMSKSNLAKNKRGRPRKYPISLSTERPQSKDGSDHIIVQDYDVIPLRNRKRSHSDALKESNNKIQRSSSSSVSSNDGHLSKTLTPDLECPITDYIINDRINYFDHSIWRPLKHPLPAPDPIVPFIGQLSNTGLSTARKMKLPFNKSFPQDPLSRIEFSELISDSMPSDNLTKQNFSETKTQTSTNFITTLSEQSAGKIATNNIGSGFFNNNQYYLQNSIFNQLTVPMNISSIAYNTSLLPPPINTNIKPFTNCPDPIINTLSSLFSPLIPAVSPSLLYDHCYRQMMSNSHSNITDRYLSSASTHSTQQAVLQHHQYNNNIVHLSNKCDSVYPNLAWNKDYQWKY